MTHHRESQIAPGVPETSAQERANLTAGVVLAGTMATMPLLLLLPVDTDRAIALFFLPVVLLSWKASPPRTSTGSWLVTWALAAMLLAAILAEHAARALVMTAAVGWTIAGGLAARRLARWPAAVTLTMVGITVGSVLGLLMLRWGVGGATMPLPTYWSARLFGAHQFAGCIASLGLLVIPRIKRKALVIAAALLVWTGLAWSGSRGPVLGLAVFIGLWFWRGTTAERKALLFWVPLLALSGLLLSYPLGAPYAQLGWVRAASDSLQATDVWHFTSARSEFWQATWSHIAESPWTGHGADAYIFIHPTLWGNQPHNVILQWLLEYGLIGTIPLVLLLIGGSRGILLPAKSSYCAHTPTQRWLAAGLCGISAYGLVEGVFYHAIIFMPVAVFAGLAWGQAAAPDATPSKNRFLPPLPAVFLTVSGLVLCLHAWLGWELTHPRAVAPDSAPAKILRIFPSSTNGLSNWIEPWRSSHPEAVMEWIRWAQTKAPDAESYHTYAAQLLIWQHDYAAAEQELIKGLAVVRRDERPYVEEAIKQVRIRLQQQTKTPLGPVTRPGDH